MSDHVFARARADAAQPDQAPRDQAPRDQAPRASLRGDLPADQRHDLPDRDGPGPAAPYPMRAADFSRVPVHGMPLTSMPQAGLWADRFGTDLSSVWLHPESPRAGGRVHAVTEGDQVYFAPGRFAPGTGPGDRLLAHELAHVAQQHRSGAFAPEIAAELDADAAADTVLRGGTPHVRAPAGAGRHAYEAWEHRELGDADGGDQRKIRLPNGIELTYGQIIALSGDFYRSPEALLRAPRAELEGVIAAMEDERKDVAANPDRRLTSADAVDVTVKYEVATMDRSPATGAGDALAGDTASGAAGPHGEVREGEHVESGAPGAEASFLDLAQANPAHFSTDNIDLNWIPKHQLALDLARKAWQTRNPDATPTNRPDPTRTVTSPGLASAEPSAPAAEQAEAQAWLAAGFADHFLTDAFAAGHLVSGDRTPYIKFLQSNADAIATACAACAAADSFLLASGAGTWATFRGILAAKGPSLLLKTVHDAYNRDGIQVRNALGQTWRTYGDSHLDAKPGADTQAMGKLAVKASRDAVQDVLETGSTARAQAALDYIPAQASLDGVAFWPISAFATEPAVRAPVLNLSLSADPKTNVVYKLIKDNLVLLPKLEAAKAAHWVGKKAQSAAKQVSDTAAEAAELPGRLEQKIKHLYGAP